MSSGQARSFSKTGVGKPDRKTEHHNNWCVQLFKLPLNQWWWQQGHLLDNLSKLSGFLQGAHHTVLDPLPDVLHTIKVITMVKLVVLRVRMVTRVIKLMSDCVLGVEELFTLSTSFGCLLWGIVPCSISRTWKMSFVPFLHKIHLLAILFLTFLPFFGKSPASFVTGRYSGQTSDFSSQKPEETKSDCEQSKSQR